MVDVNDEEKAVEEGHLERTIIGTKPKGTPIAHDEMRLREHVHPHLDPCQVVQDIED